MSQMHQSEKSPILNGLKKPKTSEKVQKMRDLEEPTSFRPFENTHLSTDQDVCQHGAQVWQLPQRVRPGRGSGAPEGVAQHAHGYTQHHLRGQGLESINLLKSPFLCTFETSYSAPICSFTWLTNTCLTTFISFFISRGAFFSG